MNLDFENDALFLDVDGTLLDLASTPEGVTVPPSLPKNLDILLHKMGGALAIITGRGLPVIDRLFKPLLLPVAGVYGAELRLSAKGTIEHLEQIPEALTQAIDQTFGSLPGVIVENKRYATVVHFSLAPQFGPMIAKKLTALIDDDLCLVEATMAFEIRRKNLSKGKAMTRFLSVQPFSGRRPIFLGDDIVDDPAIDYCRKNGGIGIKIGEKGECLATPQDVRIWIERMVSL